MNNIKILLLDSNSLVNRAFHALPLLMVDDNLYTNAIYGYLSMFIKLLEKEQPTHICAVFDCKAKTFRHNISSAYKATRKPMPEELSMQIPILQELLQKMGVKILYKEGYEADDILGTIAKKFNYSTYIVTGDRDCLQLLDETTSVIMIKKGITETKFYSSETLRNEDNFTPQQIIEYKGLAGDSSDNISGCPGIGDKTAKKLLSKYENIDNIYKSIDELPLTLKEKLLKNKDSVLLSKELATININVDIKCDLDDLKYNYRLSTEAIDMMQNLKFKKLIEKLNFQDTNAQEIFYKDDCVEEVHNKIVNVEIKEVTNEQNLKRIVNSIKPGKTFFSEFNDNWFFIITEDIGYRIKISYDLSSDGVPDYLAFEIIKPLFDKRFINVFFDVKKYLHIFSKFNIEIQKPYEDILLMGYLVDNSTIIKNVKQLLTDYGYIENNNLASVLRLLNDLKKKLNDKCLQKLYNDVELPLVEVLYEMEKSGFKIDICILDSLNDKFTEEINKLENDIFLISGNKFNINSTQQLSDVLFNHLKLKPTKKTKNGFSVDASSLDNLDHPIVTSILRYRELTKLKSTYIIGLKQLISNISGKVYTTFNQCITTTGRLSSTEPNLQNIPIRKAVGKEIRRMFVSANGQLISADYSQIELRLLAHYAEEKNLIKAYMDNKDIHTLTASEIFNVNYNDVTDEMRSAAKAVNFGIIYGISGFGLSKNANISQAQAKKFIEQYFLTYPCIKKFMDDNVKLACEQGYLTSLLGRIRYFPELKSSNRNIREFGKRAAMNMPLQGSASDIIKLAMINVYNALKKYNLRSKIILQVHDEIIIDAFDDEVQDVKYLLKEQMENVIKLKVPLVVNISSGINWYETK